PDGVIMMVDDLFVFDLGDFSGFPGAIENAGTLVHVGSGTGEIFASVISSGGVDIEEGHLQVFSITLFGTTNLHRDSPLTWRIYTFESGSSVSGTGFLVGYENTVVFEGNANVSNLSVVGGTLTGSGTTTVTSGFLWTGGRISGSGKIRIEADAVGAITPTQESV